MYSKFIQWRLKNLEAMIKIEREIIVRDKHNMSHHTLYRHVHYLDKLQRKHRRLSGRTS